MDGMNCKRVALFGERDWAIGAHHYHLSKYLSDHYDAVKLNWNKSDHLSSVVSGDFDVVIGEANIMKVLNGIDTSKVKVMPVFHHNPLDLKGHPHFDKDYSDVIDSFDVYATTEKIADAVKERYRKTSGVLPLGVCTEFWSERSVDEINTVGHVANPNGDENYKRVKGFGVFDEISNMEGKNFIKVFGRDWKTGSYIYKNVDLVVCCSKSEGTPAPLLECAAAKIPFISTDVGIVSQFPSVKTFSSAQEAKNIIRSLNTKEKIQEYVNAVYDEVISSMDYKVIKNKYISLIDEE